MAMLASGYSTFGASSAGLLRRPVRSNSLAAPSPDDAVHEPPSGASARRRIGPTASSDRSTLPVAVSQMRMRARPSPSLQAETARVPSGASANRPAWAKRRTSWPVAASQKRTSFDPVTRNRPSEVKRTERRPSSPAIFSSPSPEVCQRRTTPASPHSQFRRSYSGPW